MRVMQIWAETHVDGSIGVYAIVADTTTSLKKTTLVHVMPDGSSMVYPDAFHLAFGRYPDVNVTGERE